jgi:hypothetical protein
MVATSGRSRDDRQAMTDLNSADFRTNLSRHVDEIYVLRIGAAIEASKLEETLVFKTFPRGRRIVVEKQIARLHQVANGHAEVAYAGTSTLSLDSAFKRAGGVALTRVDGAEEDIRRARIEISNIRRGLTYEAAVLQATIATPGVPRTAVKVAVQQAERLDSAGRGDAHDAYHPFGTDDQKRALRFAGARDGLTNYAWLQESHLTRDAG